MLTDDDGREVYGPVCLKYRGGDGKDVVTISRRLGVARQLIERILNTKRHKEALDGQEREAVRQVRRHQVGMNVLRTALQAVREGT